MLFKDLVNQLKNIKKPEDISAELAQELVMAGITSYMGIVSRETPECEPEEAFDMTRIMVLKQFDLIFLEIAEEEDLFPFEDETNEISPMHDLKFRNDLQKAIDEYNKRVSKNK